MLRHVAGAIAVLALGPTFEAHADAKAAEAKVQLCLVCHREAPDKRFAPLLEGQPVDYLVAALTAFKTGKRQEMSMTTNAAGLSEAEIREISAFFASKPLAGHNEDPGPERFTAARKWIAETNCTGCHGEDFHGNGAIPRLAGQKPTYLVVQIEAFRDGRRGHPVALAVKDRSDIETLAIVLGSLP